MFTKHRGTLTLLMLLAMGSVALVGGWWLWSLPVVPATATRSQLLRGLVLQDLRQQPPAVQVAWVDRLQSELTSDFTLPAGAGELSPRYAQQLATNLDLLQEVWFDRRTAEYAALPPPEQPAFLQQQIELIAAWSELAALRGDNQSPEAATTELMAKIDGWITAAQGKRQIEMTRAVEDGTVCWLAHCDLSQQPHSVRRQLAARIAKELDRGAKPSVQELTQTPEQKLRLQHNAELLAESYVHLLAAQFNALPSNERPAFIYQQLANIERWQVAKLLDPTAESSSAAQWSLLEKQTPRWIEHAPAEERDHVVAFMQATAQRLLWQQMVPAWLRK